MYRILIVENDGEARTGLINAMDWAGVGFQPLAAANFTEGLHLSLAYQPRAILVDACLDGGRGAELIRQLNALCPGAVICVLLPAEEFVHMRVFMRAGARDYLLQPVDRKSLTEFIRWVRAEVISPAESLAQEPGRDPITGVDRESLSQSTQRLIEMVHIGYQEPLSLTELAAALGMSSKYIGRLFLRETGMRFSDYLLAWRMRQAKRMILGSREKISVIAKSVGYSQPNNFYIHFRNYYGISPGLLRSDLPEENQEVPNGQTV